MAVEYAVPAWVRVRAQDGAELEATIVSISARTVLVRAAAALAEGAPVHLTFIPLDGPRLEAHGVVASIVPGGIGFSLTPPTPEWMLGVMNAWAEGRPAIPDRSGAPPARPKLDSFDVPLLDPVEAPAPAPQAFPNFQPGQGFVKQKAPPPPPPPNLPPVTPSQRPVLTPPRAMPAAQVPGYVPRGKKEAVVVEEKVYQPPHAGDWYGSTRPEPASPAPARRPAVEVNPSGGLAGTSVLVVDDEPGILNLLSTALARFGCVVHAARSAKAGLEILKREPVQVILLDWLLPVVSGETMLQEVRTSYPTISVAVITGVVRAKATHAEIKKLGAEVVFNKPFSVDEIVAWIEQTRASDIVMPD